MIEPTLDRYDSTGALSSPACKTAWIGLITVHIGRPKAGSSAVQAWLRANIGALSQRGIHIVTFERDGETARIVERSSGGIKAAAFSQRYATKVAIGAATANIEAFVGRAMANLIALADQHPRVVITSEGWARLFDTDASAFRRHLEIVCDRHDVAVTCYVRPQHHAMEAIWCQWGVRDEAPMSRFLGDRVLGDRDELLYEGMRRRWSSHPARLEVRPFRPDLLRAGDVVQDFAAEVLGVDPVDGDFAQPERVNVSVSLASGLVLRMAPPGFWSGTTRSATAVDNRTLEHAKQVLDREGAVHGFPEFVQAAADVRAILHRWAHERYEADNRLLISALDWPITSFIPRPPDDAIPASQALTAIDDVMDGIGTSPPSELFAEIAARSRRSG